MKATELRIGNLVAFNHKCDIISKVEEIQQHSVRVSFDTQPNLMNALTTHPDNYIPIPLTEEWLLKFGFGKINGYGFSKSIISGKIIRTDNQKFCFYYNAITIQLEYVHELQNLYFALTGQELTI